MDRAGRRVAATPEWASLEGLAWAPSGPRCWFTASRSRRRQLAARRSRSTGALRVVLASTGRLVLHDMAPDGRVLLERATVRSEIALSPRRARARTATSRGSTSRRSRGSRPSGDTVLFYESGAGRRARLLHVPAQDRRLAARARRAPGGRSTCRPTGAWCSRSTSATPDHLDLTPTGPGRDPEDPAARRRRSRRRRLRRRRPADLRHRARRLGAAGHLAHRPRRQRAAQAAAARGPLPPPEHLPQRRLALRGVVPGGWTPPAATTPSPGVRSRCPASQKGWSPVGFDARGRLYLRDFAKRPETAPAARPGDGGAPRRSASSRRATARARSASWT